MTPPGGIMHLGGSVSPDYAMIAILGFIFIAITIGTILMPRKIVYIHDQPIRKAQRKFWKDGRHEEARRVGHRLPR